MIPENEIRLFLLMVRSLLNGTENSKEEMRRLRRWMHWESKPHWAHFLKDLEKVPLQAHEELHDALSIGQIESKIWLLWLLNGLLLRQRDYRVVTVAGWCGITSALLTALFPEWVRSVTQVDLDSKANAIARVMNDYLNKRLRFKAMTMDAVNYDYQDCDVVINTACEHFLPDELAAWIKRIPAGRYVFLQSNNFSSESRHINCYKHVHAFRKTLDLRTFLFSGEMKLEKYTRFMVAGISKGPAQ